MDRLILNNVSEYQIIRELIPYIDVNDIKKLINFLKKEKSIIDEDERFEVRIDYSKYSKSAPGQIFAFVLGKYYINLKITTIALLALLLDLKVTAGFASVAASLFGKIGKSISKLDAVDKCIILEIKKTNREYFDTDIINIFTDECFNNHLHCNMRKETKCTLTKEILVDKFDEYLKNNIMKKKGELYKLAL